MLIRGLGTGVVALLLLLASFFFFQFILGGVQSAAEKKATDYSPAMWVFCGGSMAMTFLGCAIVATVYGWDHFSEAGTTAGLAVGVIIAYFAHKTEFAKMASRELAQPDEQNEVK